MKPIDRSKPSNRRCINCVNWDTAADIPLVQSYNVLREKICDVAGGKEISYWNCCRCFRWNPNKQYTTPL